MNSLDLFIVGNFSGNGSVEDKICKYQFTPTKFLVMRSGESRWGFYNLDKVDFITIDGVTIYRKEELHFHVNN